MANLYKKPVFIRDLQTGQRVKTKSKKWWGRFRDASGRERRVPLATDKSAALSMLNELVKRAEREAAGLTDPFEENRKRPLQQHLNDFIAYLKHKGSTADYVKTTRYRILRILRGCKFAHIDQISASRVQKCLGDMRANNLSVESSNHYLRAIKMFTRWLVRDRRMAEDRFTRICRR